MKVVLSNRPWGLNIIYVYLSPLRSDKYRLIDKEYIGV
jgi:hypothetical protein